MIVARTIEEIKGIVASSCVTIGNFDGVHQGHQKLIGTVRDKARALGLLSVVVTFDPHPLRVLTGKPTMPFITQTRQKLELIAALGVELTLVLEFTRDMAALTPEEFVVRYLLQGLSMRELVIGYDYAMGKGRKGNHELLKALGEKYGYNTQRLDPVIIEDAVVSSTRIRDLVQAGEVWEARPLLGRFHQLCAPVEHGQDRGGKLLGFPTANLHIEEQLTPKPGVYALWAELDGELIPAVANIGFNPTFGNTAMSVEAHLLDFRGDLYGRELKIHFVQRIRAERKFDSLDALKARIADDVALARQILAMPEASPPRPLTPGERNVTCGG